MLSKTNNMIWILWQGGISQYNSVLTENDLETKDSRQTSRSAIRIRFWKSLFQVTGTEGHKEETLQLKTSGISSYAPLLDTIPSTGPLCLRMRSLSSPTFAFLAISPWSWVQQSKVQLEFSRKIDHWWSLWLLKLWRITSNYIELMYCLTLDLHFFP